MKQANGKDITSTHNILPENQEMEQSVIAGCILDEESRSIALDILRPSDFATQKHSRMFNACRVLSKIGEPIDHITIYEYLRTDGSIEKYPDMAQVIVEIIDYAPGVFNLNMEHYCEVLKVYAQARWIMQTSNKFIRNIGSIHHSMIMNATDEYVSEVNVILSQGVPKITNKSDSLMSRLEYLEGVYSGKNKGNGIRTEWPLFDRSLGDGFRSPLLVVLAARPGIGKTAMMLSMAKRIAENGNKAAILQLEMSEEQMWDRLLCMQSGVSYQALQSGLNTEKSERVVSAAAHIDKIPLTVEVKHNLNIFQVRHVAKVLAQSGTKIIFVDQLSKIVRSKEHARATSFELNSWHLQMLTNLKMETGLTIVLLAQIIRQAEGRKSKKPELSDLKMTGAIEEEADIVLLGYRPYPYTGNTDDQYKAEWEIAKHRNGETGTFKFDWYPIAMRFKEKEYQAPIF